MCVIEEGRTGVGCLKCMCVILEGGGGWSVGMRHQATSTLTRTSPSQNNNNKQSINMGIPTFSCRYLCLLIYLGGTLLGWEAQAAKHIDEEKSHFGLLPFLSHACCLPPTITRSFISCTHTLTLTIFPSTFILCRLPTPLIPPLAPSFSSSIRHPRCLSFMMWIV